MYWRHEDADISTAAAQLWLSNIGIQKSHGRNFTFGSVFFGAIFLNLNDEQLLRLLFKKNREGLKSSFLCVQNRQKDSVIHSRFGTKWYDISREEAYYIH